MRGRSGVDFGGHKRGDRVRHKVFKDRTGVVLGWEKVRKPVFVEVRWDDGITSGAHPADLIPLREEAETRGSL